MKNDTETLFFWKQASKSGCALHTGAHYSWVNTVHTIYTLRRAKASLWSLLSFKWSRFKHQGLHKIHFCKCHYFMLYLCFETSYFYSDPRHLIFEKNCRKPRNIKSLALMIFILKGLWQQIELSNGICESVSYTNGILVQRCVSVCSILEVSGE